MTISNISTEVEMVDKVYERLDRIEKHLGMGEPAPLVVNGHVVTTLDTVLKSRKTGTLMLFHSRVPGNNDEWLRGYELPHLRGASLSMIAQAAMTIDTQGSPGYPMKECNCKWVINRVEPTPRDKIVMIGLHHLHSLRTVVRSAYSGITMLHSGPDVLDGWIEGHVLTGLGERFTPSELQKALDGCSRDYAHSVQLCNSLWVGEVLPLTTRIAPEFLKADARLRTLQECRKRR